MRKISCPVVKGISKEANPGIGEHYFLHQTPEMEGHGLPRSLVITCYPVRHKLSCPHHHGRSLAVLSLHG